ncbi:MAG: gliding motility-associated C-terminal domain-containing protein, partial [Bacteroidota bacterium]
SGIEYRYRLATPLLSIVPDSIPLEYAAGYSEEHPFGIQNYVSLSEDGILSVYTKEAGRYLIKLCTDVYENGVHVSETCQELTLQFYDCLPKVVPAIKDEVPNADGSYTLNSCTTQIPVIGLNETQSSGNSFVWRFDDSMGERYQNFQQNTTLELPSTGTHDGQLFVSSEGCTDSVSVQVRIGDAPDSGLESEYEVCDLPITLVGNEAVDFVWEDGATENQREITTAGTYQLTVSDYCEQAQTILIKDLSESLDASELLSVTDTVVCTQLPYTLRIAEQEDLQEIYWNGEAKKSLRVTESGLYTVLARTAQGCEYSDEIFVEVADCAAQVYVPNAFSPNGDGVNDLFEASIGQGEAEQLRIFDRWGNLVYSGSSAWD